MKESKKNMTESVTDEIETLEDNFRSLDKNMQAEQKEPDIYNSTGTEMAGKLSAPNVWL